MGVISNWIDGPYGWTAIFLIVVFFTFITILFYYTRDKYEPEPKSRIFVAYVYGIVSVVPALIISLISIDLFIASPLLSAIIIAPIIEEFAKGFFVVQLSKDESFDGPLDGLIYGAMVGSGFATVENLLYGFAATLTNIDAGVQLAFYRSLPQIVGHPLYTGIMGAGVGAYKVGLNRNQYDLIWQSIVLHGMWNGAASIADPTSFFAGLTIVIVISIIRLRDELMKAMELDRKAFERGYYEQKKIYLEYMKLEYDRWYHQSRYNQYGGYNPYQQYQQNLYGHPPPNQQYEHYQSKNEKSSDYRHNYRKPNENVDEKSN